MKASEFFADRRQSYRGDVIESLTRIVEAAEIRNNQVCYWCHKTLGEHAHTSLQCPNVTGPLFGPRKFRSLISKVCIANVVQGSWDDNGYECGKSAIGDTGLCAEHLGENGV